MNSSKKLRLGVISALVEEQEGLVEAMKGPQKLSHGMRDYTVGSLWGIDAVCVLSRIGKAAAAMTAAILVEKFEVTHIVFTGVAGSGDICVNVGDIVVAESLVQHDMDARPLFPRFEVPLTGLSHFPSDLTLSERVVGSAQDFLADDLKSVFSVAEAKEFGLDGPRVHRGLIGSGDQFIHSRTQLGQLKEALPELLAVEMEGAAVAQVCFELGIPYAVIRTISDNANEEAAVDFMRFVQTVASRYAFHVVKRLCQRLA
ncbi:5'-methylthioadenosine/adenosylhomocysteine nucleosidase [Janthinobacterium fluminis]|uniref:adenosylhomocysteine nucleosidase n=1 Tax=Janthinobacterium fluminis TaxID=2987524 RepID=A0ABT5JYU2_9BURK|nr:5'-methylthioadenosine/adenosylhomocysteine nucleosidase [Janthinobacterium fluminis]MDC8757819.1 5'-methylthioadenosine/adenosylhomocysteine nucleosidase [Janthinobacterium fluminis]